MASGKTHDWVTMALLAPVLMVCRWGLHWAWWPTLLVTLGAWAGGLLLSPDLDIRSRPFYRWGVLRFIWWPYQWALRHRSPWSHGVVWAPWLRLLYLSAVVIVLYTGLYGYLTHAAPEIPRRQVLQFLDRHLNDILILGVGIWLGSLFHVLLDGLSDCWGRLSGSRRKRR